MKNLILIVATIISISSCKKENLSPDNQLVGIWRISHYRTIAHFFNSQMPDQIEEFDVQISDAWYIKFSDKDAHDRVVVTSYIKNDESGKLEQLSGYSTINGNILIGNGGTGGPGDTTEYAVSGNSLILKNRFKSTKAEGTIESVYTRVSSVPTSSSSGGGGDGGCPSVQCSATAQSTGVRCKRMTTNCNGRCYQHQ